MRLMRQMRMVELLLLVVMLEVLLLLLEVVVGIVLRRLMLAMGCGRHMLVCPTGRRRWQRWVGRGRQSRGCRMAMAIAGLSAQLSAMTVAAVMRCRCRRCCGTLQLRAIQIEYVGYMKARALRGRHLGIKEAAK